MNAQKGALIAVSIDDGDEMRIALSAPSTDIPVYQQLLWKMDNLTDYQLHNATFKIRSTDWSGSFNFDFFRSVGLVPFGSWC